LAGSAQSEHVERLAASFGTPPTEAAADADWMPGIVESRTYTIDVTRLGSGERVRVEIAPGAAVPTDLEAGDEVIVQGVERPDGSIVAQRVVRGGLGSRADVER
jgi:hypothetical protein